MMESGPDGLGYHTLTRCEESRACSAAMRTGASRDRLMGAPLHTGRETPGMAQGSTPDASIWPNSTLATASVVTARIP